MSIANTLPEDLQLIKVLVYDKCNFEFTNPKLNLESKEYGACSFSLNSKNVQHRISKITPTKNGQFVTIWKRNEEGITQPFDVSDDIDFIIITSKIAHKLGQFIFPKQILADKGIITQNGKIGKRGIRVYPLWDIPESKQAEKTQSWQLDYFFKISPDNSAPIDLVEKLFASTL